MMSTAAIPSFYLYGEPHRSVTEGFIHVEELDDRSRPSEWTIRAHAHADLVQLFLIDVGGGGVMQVEDRTLRFEAPALLLVPAGTIHGFAWTSDSSGAVLTLARTYLDNLTGRHPELSPVFGQPRALRASDEATITVRRGMEVLMRELGWSVAGHRIAVEAALLAVLVSALRELSVESGQSSPSPGQAAGLVARFRAQIEERFRLRESIACHAAKLGTSESSLRAACASISAMSPAMMLDQRAMLEARRSLSYTNLSVSAVAYSVGFKDPAYFTRFFTRHAGCSPREYRHAPIEASNPHRMLLRRTSEAEL